MNFIFISFKVHKVQAKTKCDIHNTMISIYQLPSLSDCTTALPVNGSHIHTGYHINDDCVTTLKLNHVQL